MQESPATGSQKPITARFAAMPIYYIRPGHFFRSKYKELMLAGRKIFLYATAASPRVSGPSFLFAGAVLRRSTYP